VRRLPTPTSNAKATKVKGQEASAGRSLEAIEPKNLHPNVKNKYPLPAELHYIYQKQRILTIIEN